MSIKSIRFLNNYSGFCSSLSEATRRKLIALGIDPSTVHSESEARALIKNILELRENSNIKVSFSKEKQIVSQNTNIQTQTKENSENMLSILDYESNLKRIIMGL